MNEILQDKLRILAQDSLMLNAISVIINERIDKERPAIETTDDDSVLGQKFRAHEEAKKILQGILVDLSSYSHTKIEPNKLNRGK